MEREPAGRAAFTQRASYEEYRIKTGGYRVNYCIFEEEIGALLYIVEYIFHPYLIYGAHRAISANGPECAPYIKYGWNIYSTI